MVWVSISTTHWALQRRGRFSPGLFIFQSWFALECVLSFGNNLLHWLQEQNSHQAQIIISLLLGNRYIYAYVVRTNAEKQCTSRPFECINKCPRGVSFVPIEACTRKSNTTHSLIAQSYPLPDKSYYGMWLLECTVWGRLGCLYVSQATFCSITAPWKVKPSEHPHEWSFHLNACRRSINSAWCI